MRDQRLLLSPPLAGAGASCAAVVVDQLELAAAADGGGAAGLGGGCGAAACGGAGAGSGGGAGAEEEPVTEPNQRVRRLPLLDAAGCCPSETEVLHAPGDALAVRVGGAAGSLRAAQRLAAACARRSLALGANFGREGGDGGRVGWRAAALGDQRLDVAAGLAGRGKLGLALAAQAGRLIGKPTIDLRP